MLDKMKTAAGSLLTSGCFSDWTYSATARMSMKRSGMRMGHCALLPREADKERFVGLRAAKIDSRIYV